MFNKIKDDIDCLQKEYEDLSELVYRLSNRLDNLFKRDHNETLRLKIDLLTVLTLFFIFFYIFS